MRKSLLLTGGIIVGIILLIGVFQTFPFNELLLLLLSIKLQHVALYLSVSFAIMLMHVWRWQVVAKQHKIKVPFYKLLRYKYVGFGISYLTPGPRVGGEPARAALLKNDGIAFPRAFSSVIADKTIELTSFGLMFVVALGIALATLELTATWRAILFIITAMMLAGVIYGFGQMLGGKDPVLRLFRLLRLDRIRWLGKYEKELQEFENNIQGFYGKDKRAFWKAQAISALAWAFAMVEYKVLLTMIGFPASFVEVFLVYSVVGAAYLLPVPLALGTLEASQATLFASLGMRTTGGAAVALITRARDLLWSLIGMMLLVYFGWSNGKRAPKVTMK